MSERANPAIPAISTEFAAIHLVIVVTLSISFRRNYSTGSGRGQGTKEQRREVNTVRFSFVPGLLLGVLTALFVLSRLQLL